MLGSADTRTRSVLAIICLDRSDAKRPESLSSSATGIPMNIDRRLDRCTARVGKCDVKGQLPGDVRDQSNRWYLRCEPAIPCLDPPRRARRYAIQDKALGLLVTCRSESDPSCMKGRCGPQVEKKRLYRVAARFIDEQDS